MTTVLVLGPTGAGKGTQAAALASFCEVPHISTGDIFRANIQAETPMGKFAASALRAGELVPDSVTQAMLAERIRDPDTKEGFVLDGFPRTTGQATWLDAMLTGGSDVAAVIVLAAPDEVLLDRAQRRGRIDDTTAAINRRLTLYRERTQPLLAYFGKLVTVIDGARDTELVHDDIVSDLQRRITHA